MPYSLPSLFATPSAQHNMSEAWISRPSSNGNHNENEIIHYEERVQRKRVKLEKQMIAYNWRAQQKAQIKQSKWR